MSTLLSIVVIMPLTELIYNLNVFFWLLPVFRQYRDGYFYYFLVLAISEPLFLLCLHTLKIYPMYFYLAVSYFSLLAVLYYKKRLKISFALSALILTIFFYADLLSASAGIFLLHFIIFYNILDIFMKETITSQRINLYFVVMLFYEATILLKMAVKIMDFSSGIYFYYIITAFDIFVAIYFIFCNIRTSPKLKLRGLNFP